MESSRLRDLRALAVTAQLGSAGAAGRALGLSQPAISQAVARLEVDFVAPLLARGPRGSSATAQGTLLLDRIARMERQLLAGCGGSEAAARRLTDSAIAAHLAIVADGGIAAAARARGMAPPSLHRAARGLAASLGQALYRPSARGLVASPAGVELARRFALAHLEVTQARAELQGGGSLVLGTLPLLPRPPLARALAASGGLAVHARDGDYAELVALLRGGQVDAILGALRAPPPFEDVQGQAWCADPFAIAAGVGFAGRPESAPWVLAAPGMPRRAVAEALFASMPQRPAVLVETSSLETTAAVLREGAALALLSASQVTALPGLKALPMALPGAPRILGLTTRRDWRPTPRQARFLDALRVGFSAAPKLL